MIFQNFPLHPFIDPECLLGNSVSLQFRSSGWALYQVEKCIRKNVTQSGLWLAMGRELYGVSHRQGGLRAQQL